jgi:predicted protein tyrosine phosphatase
VSLTDCAGTVSDGERNDGREGEAENHQFRSYIEGEDVTWADVVVGKERRELRKMDNSFRESLSRNNPVNS